ncbi:MAG: phage terminase large subunit family protein [Nitrosomonas sp.]|nr:phage terminase large subunit family protein [Nitrosomonas sp.]
MKNENQEPLEFKDHRFMIDIYADESTDIVCKKSAQVGFSVMAILKCLWLLKYAKVNVIYALPTNNVVQDFVKPKVDPLISGNKVIADSMGSESVSQKKVGDRFIYFKGGFSDREAISITGDILVIDEYDRMPSMQVVNTFDSRLQASKHPRRWRFSNPSAVGFGVDGLYNDSDQMHWMVTCSTCKHVMYMDFERSEELISQRVVHSHYVDQERQIYACGECHSELNYSDRRNGEWKPKHPDRKRRGYWISQMMAPWVSAKRILEQKEESGIEFFYNFVLGKAYTPSDLIVNRATILRACSPSSIQKREVAMGVDTNLPMTYTLATPDGIFQKGRTNSWDDIERLKLMYKAVMVMDPNPYPTIPKQMVDKYPGSAFICYFKQDTKNLGIIQYGTGVNASVIYADRTKILDLVAQEKADGQMLYRLPAHELEDVIADWENIYRTTEEKEDGRVKSVWIKKEGKTSDYPFSEAYCRIGLSRLMGRGTTSSYIDPVKNQGTGFINKQGAYVADLSQDLAEALEQI